MNAPSGSHRLRASGPDAGFSVSVVIPARNEAVNIGDCVESVKRQLEGRAALQVIVADHASTDDTAERASRLGAQVVFADGRIATIGALRNLATERATGDILVFLDADVTAETPWGRRLSEVAPELRPGSKVLAGSVCEVPANPGWVEEVWFQNRLERPSHLGTGHMIVAADFFRALGGFDASLATGEDFEFCQRALSQGGRICIDPQLRVIHHGFPKTLGQFVRREMWHGSGDYASFAGFLKSKVACASTLFLGLHLAALVALGAGSKSLAGVVLLGIAGLHATFTIAKFGSQIRRAPFRIAFLSYAYLMARSLSPMLRLRPGCASTRVAAAPSSPVQD